MEKKKKLDKDLNSILEKVKMIQTCIDKGRAAKVDRNACQAIDIKLRKVKNPTFDATSKQFQASEKKKKLKKEEQRAAKLRKRQDEEDRKIAELTGASSFDLGTSEPFSISRRTLKTPKRLRTKE